ncbi:MAG: DNA primase [Flavobacteriales bacterium]|nr:DNA primase [Flavobacteriales bacterium]
MIPKHTIDQIFEAAIIEEVVGEFVVLKKRGANLLGNCPFHNEKTPSFTVSPAKGIYKCFGCGKAGNSVNFIMEHEHYTYPEALRYLANKYQIEIEELEETDAQKQAANEKESLFIVSNFAANYFQKQLHETQEGRSIGLSYFVERGFREDIIKKFELGYNPDSWNAFTAEALAQGYQLEFLEKSGLTIVKEQKHFDRFKGRVMFPIHNLSGRVLGFGGRILKTDPKAAKYVNSPESEIYHKSNVLYGIYFAKKSIIEQDNCFLVEGYTDVISLHQSGVENVVASSGTSLTEGQIRLISRYTQNITILYDGDAAGIKASFRGIDMILQEGMNVRVVLFPDGEDPDSFAKKHNATELTTYIKEHTQDFISFKTDVLIKEVGNDPIKRAELIKEIVASIAVIPDQIKRSVYTKECSNLLSIPENALINETNKILRKNLSKTTQQNFPNEIETYTPISKDEKIEQESDSKHWEYEIIRLLITYGDKIIALEVVDNENKKQEQLVATAVYIISSIAEDQLVFDNPLYQQIVDEYTSFLNKEIIPSHQDFINHTNAEINSIAISILSNKYDISENWQKHSITVTKEEEQIKMAAVNTVFAFKLSKLNQLIEKLQNELKTCSNDEDMMIIVADLTRYQQVKKQLAAQLGRIILR